MSGNRATKSGIAAESKKKMDAKYDEELAGKCMTWVNERITSIHEDPINTSGASQDVATTLNDGYVLCCLMKSLGDTFKFKKSTLAFKKMECINQFSTAAERYGVPKTELFQTVDLYEAQNMTQVVQSISALARKVNSKGGPGFGPKESERQSREWTDEQLRAGQGVIGLQMGTNKGASQSGQNFGKARSIVD